MDENGRVGLLEWLILYRGTKKVRIVVICQNQSSFISCFFTFEATSCIKQQVCQQGDHVCLSWTHVQGSVCPCDSQFFLFTVGPETGHIILSHRFFSRCLTFPNLSQFFDNLYNPIVNVAYSHNNFFIVIVEISLSPSAANISSNLPLNTSAR